MDKGCLRNPLKFVKMKSDKISLVYKIMKFSKKSNYGLKGLLYLARKPENKAVLTSEVSEKQNIPPSFLTKIFQKLSKAGILRSHRGAKGGFFLAKKPGEITLKRIIETLEGPIKFDETKLKSEEFEDLYGASDVAIMTTWQRIQHKISKMLEKTTILDVLKKAKKVEKRKINE